MRTILGHNGIPTFHKARQFRSRLEARWAAFFDLVGWPYEYEPFDLDGWIPDFLLIGANVLVEVKPVMSFPSDVAAKIDLSGFGDRFEPMIVGCSIPVFQSFRPVVEAFDGTPIGWIKARPMTWQPDLKPEWCDAVVQEFNEVRPVLSDPNSVERVSTGLGLFSNRDHRFHCDPGYQVSDDDLFRFANNRFRLTDDLLIDGDGSNFSRLSHFEPSRLFQIWAETGNRTQWKRPAAP